MPRLDQELVRQGLAQSRARAQAMIAAGAVALDGTVLRKPGKIVAEGAALTISGDPIPYVSRGGLKLAHALDHFGIDPQGLAALDLGASTGGFTDVLLSRGAAQVVAVDVGHGQLHPRIAADARCTALERTDVRDLRAADVGAPDLVVADLAFISLTKALGVPLALAPPGARLIALVKPQFELEPAQIGKGGIVRSAAARAAALARVEGFVVGEGWRVLGKTDSPVTGGDGNREFLLLAQKQKGRL